MGPLLGGNLKKIVTFGTKRFVCYSMACPLFGISAIGRFHSHCITVAGAGFYDFMYKITVYIQTVF